MTGNGAKLVSHIISHPSFDIFSFHYLFHCFGEELDVFECTFDNDDDIFRAFE